MTPRPASTTRTADAADAASSPSAKRRAADASVQDKHPSNKQKLARFRSHPERNSAPQGAPDPYGYDGWNSSRLYTNPSAPN